MSPSGTPVGPDRGRAAEPDRPGRSEPDVGPERAAPGDASRSGAGQGVARPPAGSPSPLASAAAVDVASAAARVVERWRLADTGSSRRVTEFPDAAALAVVTAVLAAGTGRLTATDGTGRGMSTVSPELQAAGDGWASAHRSVSELVDRLSLLRDVLAEDADADRRALDRAVDEVTAAAAAALVTQLERLSRTDPLTGVGNRRAFDEAVQRALATAARQGHEVTMVVVDLDGLKRINDSRGHAAGDAALGSLVQAFAAALRDTDTVYRVGGDEFVVLLPLSGADQVELLMRRVAAAGAPAFTWGAASFPGDVADAGLLFDRADRALYDRRLARRRGPGSFGGILRPLRVPGVLDEGIDIRRWAWVPAAAAVAGLVAFGVLASGGGRQRTTSSALPGHDHGATTAPGIPASRPAGRRIGSVFPPPADAPSGSGAAATGGGSVHASSAGSGGSANGNGAPGAGAPAGTRVVSVVRPAGGRAPTASSPSPGVPSSPVPAPSPSQPAGTGTGNPPTGSGPVGSLVGGVGQVLSGVPVAQDIITPGPGGSTTVLGLVQLSGGQPVTAAANSPSSAVAGVAVP